MATGCSTNLAALQSLYDAKKTKNVLVTDAPSNDIANQVSFADTAAAQSYADTFYTSTALPCIASLKATGFKVVATTIIARGGWQLGTGNFLDDARLRYNANLIGGAVANGYSVADRAGSPFFSAASAVNNLGCYSSDTVHLLSFCYGVMEAIDKSQILNFLLNRDINPASNDNSPVGLTKAA